MRLSLVPALSGFGGEVTESIVSLKGETLTDLMVQFDTVLCSSYNTQMTTPPQQTSVVLCQRNVKLYKS
jgi:hypothetical protein